MCKGNLRGEPEAVYSRLTANLQQRLGDRFRLFLLPSPDEKPVVVVLPSRNDPQPLALSQKLLAGVLLMATFATSLETAGIFLGFDFFQQIQRFPEVLPIAGGILTILAAHELGHQWQARRHQVGLSLPFFIPTWQIAAFGALNRFTSWVPSRKVLFDVAFAGPAAGGLVAFAMLLGGLLLSQPDSQFQISSEFFQGSVLVGSLAKVILGSALHQPIVSIHPLVVIGWLGLVITALNLMPAGQLDGGRIMLAIYGRKTAGRATIVTLIILAIAALANPLALYWGIVILFLQRDLERPSFNELTEPDDARAALGLLALVFNAGNSHSPQSQLGRSLGDWWLTLRQQRFHHPQGAGVKPQVAIEVKRRLVRLKHLQSQLAIAAMLGPGLGMVHQRCSQSLATMFRANIEQKNMGMAIAGDLIHGVSHPQTTDGLGC